jgi:hypothetical protein
LKLTLGGRTVELTPAGAGYQARLGEQTASIEGVRAEDGRLELSIDGRRVVAHVTFDGARCWVTVDGRTLALTRSSGPARRRAAGGPLPGLTAPMPGQVRSVNV